MAYIVPQLLMAYIPSIKSFFLPNNQKHSILIKSMIFLEFVSWTASVIACETINTENNIYKCIIYHIKCENMRSMIEYSWGTCDILAQIWQVNPCKQGVSEYRTIHNKTFIIVLCNKWLPIYSTTSIVLYRALFVQKNYYLLIYKNPLITLLHC